RTFPDHGPCPPLRLCLEPFRLLLLWELRRVCQKAGAAGPVAAETAPHLLWRGDDVDPEAPFPLAAAEGQSAAARVWVSTWVGPARGASSPCAWVHLRGGPLPAAPRSGARPRGWARL